MSPKPPNAMTDDDHAAIPRRVDTLERNFEAFRRDVADEFRGIRVDSARQSEAILAKIESQGRDLSAAQAEALRKGQFSLSSTFKALVTAGSFILAVVAAGATALKAPIEADIARDRADIQEIKRNSMSRDELMVRFATMDRDIDRGAQALSRLADAAVMKSELDYRLNITGKQRDEAFAAIDRRIENLRIGANRN